MAEMEIHRNDRVMTADGMEVGHVKHVIVDGTTRQVTDIVVDQDGHEMLVPLSNVLQSGGNSLTLRSTGDELATAAAFDRGAYHALDDDALYDESQGRAVPGSATLEHASGDTVVIADERGMDTAPAVGEPANRRRNDERLARREAGRDYSRDDENITVPVVEEQLKAGVRETEAGRARIVRDVREEEQSIAVPVEREELYITERAANRPATREELAARDRDIEIPLREQEVVTEKQAVVTGEVNVRKETVAETERVTDTVRRESVHVEDPSNPRVHVEGDLGATGQGAGATGGTGKTVTDRRQYDAQGNLVDEKVSEEPNRRT
jgi:uncharacterized protein (TIGR02271 family)